MTERGTERNPYERLQDLPLPEVGDYGSFEREPEHGREDAPAPEPEPDGGE